MKVTTWKQIAALLLLCVCGILSLVSAFFVPRAAQAAAADEAEITDLSGEAWRTDRPGNISGNGYMALGEDGYETDRSFFGEYTARFKMRVLSGEYADAVLFTLSLGDALTVEVREGDVRFPGTEAGSIVRHYTERASGVDGTELWRYYNGTADQQYKWCPFASQIVNEWNTNIVLSGTYDFTFEVGESAVDIYIAPADAFYRDESLRPTLMYTVQLPQAAEGTLRFERGDSQYEFEIGAMSVTSDTDSFIEWNDDFAENGSNYFDSLGQNLAAFSNFSFTADAWTAEFEVQLGTSGDWNDLSSRLEFVFGVTDARPQGYTLGFISQSYVGYFEGAHFKNSAPLGGNGLRYLPIRIKMHNQGNGWMSFYYSVQQDGVWTDYVLADEEHNSNARFSDFGSIFGQTPADASGGIAVRVVSESGTTAPSAYVRMLSATGTISDEVFCEVDEDALDNAAISDDGTFTAQLPRVALWSPAGIPESKWEVTAGSDIARINENGVLQISSIGDVTLKFTVPSEGIEEEISFTVRDLAGPVITVEEDYFFAEAGKGITEEQVLAYAAAEDNSGECDLTLESAQIYANETAFRAGNGTALQPSGGTYTPANAGIVRFTLKSQDPSNNVSHRDLICYVSAISVEENFGDLVIDEKGEILTVDLPRVTTVAESYTYQVLSGGAAVGMGENEGKLLIYGSGEIRLYVGTGLEGVEKEITLQVADGIIPEISIGLPLRQQTGSEITRADAEAAISCTDESGAADLAGITLTYYASREDAENGTNGTVVDCSQALRFDRAGWYVLTAEATDVAGNRASQSVTFTVTDPPQTENNVWLIVLTSVLGVAALGGVAAVIFVLWRKKHERS